MGLPLSLGDAEHRQTIREDRKGGERLPGVTGSVQGCKEALSFRGRCRGAIHTGILGVMVIFLIDLFLWVAIRHGSIATSCVL